MTTTILYSGMGASLTPVYVEGRTQSAYVRLSADENKVLKKGNVITSSVDVPASDVSNWTEVDDPGDDLDDAELVNILLGEGLEL